MTMGTYTKVGMVEESSFGVTPASALQLVNVTDIKLPRNQDRKRPEVLTGDRRRYRARILKKSGEGLGLSMPGQYENDLLLLEGLLNNARGAAVTISGTTIALTATSITDSANGFTNLQSGDLIYVSGFTTSPTVNNGWKGPIVKVSNGELTIPAGQLSGVVAAGESVTIKTRRLIDGSTLKSYSIEEQFTKLTTQFRNSTGQRVKSLKQTWQQNDWCKQDWVLDGKVPGMADATIGTGAATAAKTSGFLNSVDDFQLFKFGGTGVGNIGSAILTKWDLSVVNVLALIYGLGVVGPQQSDVGPFDVEVGLNAMFDDNSRDLIDAAESDAVLWCWWAIVDPQGNRMAFSLPAVTVDVQDVPPGGAENLVAFDAKLMAHDPAKDSSSTWYSSSFGYQFGVYFVPAV